MSDSTARPFTFATDREVVQVISEAGALLAQFDEEGNLEKNRRDAVAFILASRTSTIKELSGEGAASPMNEQVREALSPSQMAEEIMSIIYLTENSLASVRMKRLMDLISADRRACIQTLCDGVDVRALVKRLYSGEFVEGARWDTCFSTEKAEALISQAIASAKASEGERVRRLEEALMASQAAMVAMTQVLGVCDTQLRGGLPYNIKNPKVQIDIQIAKNAAALKDSPPLTVEEK